MTANSFSSRQRLRRIRKASGINSVAWRIIDQEAATREKKTEKLRALRLAKEVTNPAPLPRLKRK